MVTRQFACPAEAGTDFCLQFGYIMLSLIMAYWYNEPALLKSF